MARPLLTEANLSRAVQWLNVSYSVGFNRRHGRSGHLLQGRFKSVAVSREEWGLELSRYVHLHPVRIQGLGLSKQERRAQRMGLSAAPNAEVVRPVGNGSRTGGAGRGGVFGRTARAPGGG
jgi:hypothetical protein